MYKYSSIRVLSVCLSTSVPQYCQYIISEYFRPGAFSPDQCDVVDQSAAPSINAAGSDSQFGAGGGQQVLQGSVHRHHLHTHGTGTGPVPGQNRTGS